MSIRSLPSDDRSPSVRSLLRRLNDTALTTPVQLVAFWSAIVLPLVQVHYLLSGLRTADEATTFGTLLALNLLALAIGHSYRRD